MKVYLAAPYIAREQVKAYAKELRLMGFEVTSTWLDEAGEIVPGVLAAAPARTTEQAREHVRADFRDIDRADVLVMFTAAAAAFMTGKLPLNNMAFHSGGRHVEVGYALAKRKTVIVIGPDENIFQRAATQATCPTWHSAVIELVKRRELSQYGLVS